MSCISGSDYTRHLVMHSILNVGEGGATDPNADLSISGGHLYLKDNTRGNKWLSADRFIVSAARKGRAKNSYLNYTDGQSSLATGIRIPRNATIMSIVAQTRGTETWTAEVRRNGSATVLTSLSLSAVAGDESTTLNIDVVAGDRIQVYANTTAMLGVRDPNVWVELAWRL